MSSCTPSALPLYLVLLELAEGPHSPQVPAGPPAVGEALYDQLDVRHALLGGRGLAHGGGGVGDPGAPVVLQGTQWGGTEDGLAFHFVVCSIIFSF